MREGLNIKQWKVIWDSEPILQLEEVWYPNQISKTCPSLEIRAAKTGLLHPGQMISASLYMYNGKIGYPMGDAQYE